MAVLAQDGQKEGQRWAQVSYCLLQGGELPLAPACVLSRFPLIPDL